MQNDSNAKAMTIRLPAEQSAVLEKIAQVEGVSMAEAVRTAVTEHIDARRSDPDFQRRVRDIIENDRAILRKLVA